MSADLHQQAMDLAGQADVLRLRQPENIELQKALYQDAGRLEAEVFEGIPLDRPRTRRIIAQSAVALFHHAEDWAEVERLGKRYLVDLAEDADSREYRGIREMVDEARGHLPTSFREGEGG